MPFSFELNGPPGMRNPSQDLVQLVNGWLRPTGCSFAVSPPAVWAGTVPAVPVPEAGRGRFLGAVPAGAAGRASWQNRFAALLSRLLTREGARRVTILISRGNEMVRVGQFANAGFMVQGGTIDVGDLERLPSHVAGGAFLHELTEQWERQANGTNAFNTAHSIAVGADKYVTGEERIAEFETRIAPGRRRGAVEDWTWWLCYRRSGSGGARLFVLEMTMRGMDVQTWRYRPENFSNLAAVSAAAQGLNMAPPGAG